MPCGRHRGEIEHPGGDWDGTAHFSGNQLVSTLMNSPPGRRSAEDLSTTGVVLPEIGAIKVRVVASHSPVRDVVDNDRLVRFAQSVPQGPTTRCALRPQPMRTRSGSSGSIVGIFSPVSSYLSLRQNRVQARKHSTTSVYAHRGAPPTSSHRRHSGVNSRIAAAS